MKNNINGFPGYSVTTSGDIISRKRGKEKLLYQKTHKQGYKEVNLSNNGITRTLLVHRIVAKAFIPNPHNKPEVNHKDGNKANNHVDNLEWVTVEENNLHAKENGFLKPRYGELSGTNKLTKNDVLDIRRKYNDGVNQATLCREYEMSPAQIHRIVKRKRWAWL